MQPTMKLRWKRAERRFRTDPAIDDSYGQGLVLQQWWSKGYMDKDGAGYVELKGEWRDIEIQEE